MLHHQEKLLIEILKIFVPLSFGLGGDELL